MFDALAGSVFLHAGSVHFFLNANTFGVFLGTLAKNNLGVLLLDTGLDRGSVTESALFYGLALADTVRARALVLNFCNGKGLGGDDCCDLGGNNFGNSGGNLGSSSGHRLGNGSDGFFEGAAARSLAFNVTGMAFTLASF